MKVNIVMLLISLCLGVLGGYAFWSANSSDTHSLLITFIPGFFLFMTLSGVLAIKAKQENGTTGNIRVVSVLFFILFLVTNTIFSFFNFQDPALFIIINGIEFLVYILIIYGICKSLN